MPRKLDFEVTSEFDGVKLIVFLRGHVGISARLLVKLKNDPLGLLRNGEHIRTVDKLQTGDIITVNMPEEKNGIEPTTAEGLDVIFEDEDVLIINKPAGIAMHPTHNHQGDTLANAVSAYLSKKGKSAAFRSVGRLDKGTSGVVVCALNPLAASKLAGGVKKEYCALVQGNLSGEGRVDVPIYRPDPMKTLRACSYELGVEPAVTNWRAEREFVNATLLSLRLETGRTHQIRVHMAYCGHPLAGDGMYGGFMPEIGHQLLHCRNCTLIHPVTGEIMKFEASFPEDFENALKKCGINE